MRLPTKSHSCIEEPLPPRWHSSEPSSLASFIALAKGWVQQINATTLAFDPRSWWMLSAVPCKKSGQSVGTVFIAVPALIADIVKPDNQGGGVVELLDRAQLAIERAELRVAV